MKYKLSEILNIYKPEEIDAFLKDKCGNDLNDRNIKYDDIKNNWMFVGKTQYNASTIDMLSNPDKGLVERITNGIDAVLEKEKVKHNIENPKTSDDIIKVAFPRFYQNRCDLLNGKVNRQNACDAADMVVVAINDSCQSNKPTIDVVDKGCGIEGNDFINTILSIHNGNKSKTDKNYLIGAFGQGGSTSLPYSYSTLIVSKKNSKFYFTIVKKVTFVDNKMKTYMYFAPGSIIAEVENDLVNNHKDMYINDFVNSESGTLIRMIDMEISREYRSNDISKPRMLSDFINTELYKVALPVKMIENRANYINNQDVQNRYSYGSFYKMFTWKYARKEKFGTIEIEHNNREYKINYYVILPEEETKWAKDIECKNVYEQFNVHSKPIIYTVNGQYIADEEYTKLKNKGLGFLKYRLLIDVNLDILGKEKYDFFTTDRASIKENDLSKGFLDKVVDQISKEQTIIELNDYIANMSVSSNIDEDLLSEISGNVKSLYNKYLISGSTLNIRHGHRNTPDEEEIYYDNIKTFIITTKNKVFYKNDALNFVVTTKAKKSVNSNAKIDAYVDGRNYLDYVRTNLNGRIQFTLGKLSSGKHSVDFCLYNESNEVIFQTENYEFVVLEENKPKSESSQAKKNLDLDIQLVDEKELVADISLNDSTKKITIQLCLTHDLLVDKLYGRTTSNDEVQQIKNSIVEPISLYLLFNREIYDSMEDSKKNDLILGFCNTIYISLINRQN